MRSLTRLFFPFLACLGHCVRPGHFCKQGSKRICFFVFPGFFVFWHVRLHDFAKNYRVVHGVVHIGDCPALVVCSRLKDKGCAHFCCFQWSELGLGKLVQKLARGACAKLNRLAYALCRDCDHELLGVAYKVKGKPVVCEREGNHGRFLGNRHAPFNRSNVCALVKAAGYQEVWAWVEKVPEHYATFLWGLSAYSHTFSARSCRRAQAK